MRIFAQKCLGSPTKRVRNHGIADSNRSTNSRNEMPTAAQIARTSNTSRRRSPASYLLTNDCGSGELLGQILLTKPRTQTNLTEKLLKFLLLGGEDALVHGNYLEFLDSKSQKRINCLAATTLSFIDGHCTNE